MTEEKKDEMKDEMKNRISMALKDPILQQGFEIICKNLAELESQIATLEERCNQLLKDKGDLTDELDNQMVAYETLKLHDQEEIGMLNSRVAELEKENAELKEQLNFKTRFVKGEKAIEQLTKAKKILEELANMEYSINPPADKVRSLMVKAEQFLKEIEK